MSMHTTHVNKDHKKEIIGILIYVAIVLVGNVVASLLVNILINPLYRLLCVELDFPYIVFNFTYNAIVSILMAAGHGLVARKLVFHTQKSPKKAIGLLSVLYLVRNVILGLLSMVTSVSVYSTLSFFISWISFGLGYLLQRRLYTQTTEPVISSRVANAIDNDPAIVTVDLEAIDQRIAKAERNRILAPGANKEREKRGLFNRFNVENDNERVIAQSSRDAIRVMEHKELGIKHEWNCDERSNARPTGTTQQRVIAPGNRDAIHVTEHNRLDMKHEWNCDDKKRH